MQAQQPLQPVNESSYSATPSCALAQNLYFLFEKRVVDQAICAALRPNNGILCSRETVWCYGENGYGQLGIGSTDAKQEPVTVVFADGALQDDEKMVWVGACSNQNGPCFILTSTGTLYGFGYNGHGTVGINTTNNQYSPVKITGPLDGKKVCKVAAGEYHVLALTDDGQLFGWGYGANGAHGLATTGNVTTPTRVKNLDNEKIVDIEVSTYFSLALTADGDLYSWGLNGNGQLGLDHTTNPTATPTLVQTLKGKKIIQVSAGEGHCLALSNTGEVYSWGVNSNGQLGLGHQNQVNKPTLIFHVTHCVAVHAFRNLSVVRRAGGESFIFGHKLSLWNVSLPQKIPDNPDGVNPVQIFFRHFSLHPKSFFIHPQTTPTQQLLDQLEKSFDQKEGSDITFQVENKLIYAHKAILQLRNPVFKNSLSQDAVDKPMMLEKFKYEVWHAFFKYLYTGTVNVSAEVAIELVRCMNWHQEEQGQLLCAAIVRTGTNIENCSMIFGLASTHNMTELRDFSKGFIFRNFKAVVNTQGYETLSLQDPKLVHSLIKDGSAFPNLYGY